MAHNVTVIVAATYLTCIAFSSARNFPDFVDALTELQLMDNNLDALEGVWSASYDRQWLQTVIDNISLLQYPASNMSRQCTHDLHVWADSLKSSETWAMRS